MFIPAQGSWSLDARASSIIFPLRNETLVRTISLCVSLTGLFVVSVLLGMGIEKVAVRRLAQFDVSFFLSLLVISLSFLFFFFSLVITHGIGLSFDSLACSVVFDGYFVFISLIKFSFYSYLWERTESLWRTTSAQKLPFLYRMSVVVAWQLVGVAVGVLSSVFGSSSHFESHAQCPFDIRNGAGIILLALDCLVAAVFAIKVSMLLLRSKSIEGAKQITWKCLFGSLLIPAVSFTTIGIPIILGGKEMGWVCLLSGSCSSGLLAIAAKWVQSTLHRGRLSVRGRSSENFPWIDPAATSGVSTAGLVVHDAPPDPVPAQPETLSCSPARPQMEILSSPYSVGMEPHDGGVDSFSLDGLSGPEDTSPSYIVPSPDIEKGDAYEASFYKEPSPTNPSPYGPRRPSKARVKVKPYLPSINTARTYSIDHWVPSTPISPLEQLRSFQFPPLPTPDSPDNTSFAQAQHPSLSFMHSEFQIVDLVDHSFDYRHRNSSPTLQVTRSRIPRKESVPAKGILKSSSTGRVDRIGSATSARRPSIAQTVQNYWFPRKPSAQASSLDEYQISEDVRTRGHAYRHSSTGTIEYDYAETVDSRS